MNEHRKRRAMSAITQYKAQKKTVIVSRCQREHCEHTYNRSPRMSIIN